MSKFTNLFNVVRQYNENGIKFSPESMFGYHAHSIGLNIVEGDFEVLLRHGGGHVDNIWKINPGRWI